MDKMRIILAIDDMPSRYQHLAGMARNNPTSNFGQLGSPNFLVLVSCSPEEIEFYLNHYRDMIGGICLDYDMPMMNGEKMAARFLAERNIPVIVVSQNPAGSKAICSILESYAVPYCGLPYVATEGMIWEERALRWFLSFFQG